MSKKNNSEQGKEKTTPLIRGGTDEVARVLRDYYCRDREIASDFTLEFRIHGGFGDVFSIIWGNGRKQIVKVIFTERSEAGTERILTSTITEIMALYHCRGQAHITQMTDAYIHNRTPEEEHAPWNAALYYIFIFLEEYTPLSDDYIKRTGISERYIGSVLNQVSEALAYLHKPYDAYREAQEISKKYLEPARIPLESVRLACGTMPLKEGTSYRILHLDIAANNLFTRNSEPDAPPFFLLGDLGSARLWDGISPVEIIGKRQYLSPPEIEHGTPDCSSDVFMLGATAIWLAENGDKTWHKVLASDEELQQVSERFSNVLRKATMPDRQTRYQTTDELLAALAAVPLDDALMEENCSRKALLAIEDGVLEKALCYAEKGVTLDEDNIVCARVYALLMLEQAYKYQGEEREDCIASAAQAILPFVTKNDSASQFIFFGLCEAVGDMNNPDLPLYLKHAADYGIPAACYLYAKYGKRHAYGISLTDAEFLWYMNRAIDLNHYIAIAYMVDKIERGRRFNTEYGRLEELREKLANISPSDRRKSLFLPCFD